MGDTKQPRPAGTGPTSAEAAAALAEIQERQEHVIKTTLVPGWYWWVMAAAIVAIGAARDSGDPLVEATIIPIAVLVMGGLIVATIPGVRRRVRVHNATQPGARAAPAIIGLIVLVDGVIIGTAASLSAARVPHPVTIATAAGAAVLVIGGPLVNGYARRLMLSQGRQQMNDAQRPEAAPQERSAP